MSNILAMTSAHYLDELGKLAVAFALGGAVAALRLRLRGPSGHDSLAWVLVVLAPLMCLVVRAIEGDSAKAFALVGILALVRFRTPMRDPADAVFVLMSVAVGVVVAARGDLWMAVLGVMALGLGAWVAHALLVRRFAGDGPSTIEVRLRCRAEALEAAEDALRGLTQSMHLVRAEVGAAGSPCDLRYQVELHPDHGVAHLARGLGAVAGVEQMTATATASAEASAKS